MDETKVLLILVDGMRPDSLARCGSPHAAALLSQSAYTPACKAVFPPVTLPCHMSLFHSVPPTRHGVTTNRFTPPARPVTGLCERLHAAGKSCAFYYNWEELRDLARPGSLDCSVFVSGSGGRYAAANAAVARAAKAAMLEAAPDFVFLYLGLTDEVGHACGWMSEPYLEAVRDSFALIDEVLRGLPPAYSVIVTADHGGHGRTHGDDCPEDMRTPLLLRGPRFRPGGALPEASILDLAPTVAALLGVAAAPDWEGRSLL